MHVPTCAKLSVLGDGQHRLCAALTAAQTESIGEGPMREELKAYGVDPANKTDVLWNFEKFVIGRNGQVVARFAPDVTAEDPRLVSLLDAELAKQAV